VKDGNSPLFYLIMRLVYDQGDSRSGVSCGKRSSCCEWIGKDKMWSCPCAQLSTTEWRHLAYLSATPWRCIGSGGIAPRIVNLSTRWNWVDTFTFRPLYPRRKSPRCPLDRRLGGPQRQYGRKLNSVTGRHLKDTYTDLGWWIILPATGVSYATELLFMMQDCWWDNNKRKYLFKSCRTPTPLFWVPQIGFRSPVPKHWCKRCVSVKDTPELRRRTKEGCANNRYRATASGVVWILTFQSRTLTFTQPETEGSVQVKTTNNESIISVGFWRSCISIKRIVFFDFIHRLVSQE